jgi:hypothetical protein
VPPAQARQDFERPDVETRERVIHLAANRLRQVEDVRNNVVFSLYLLIQPVLRPPFVLEWLAGLLGEQPRHMEREIIDLDLLQDGAQPGSMIGIAVRQHDMFEDRVRAEILFQVRHDILACSAWPPSISIKL